MTRDEFWQDWYQKLADSFNVSPRVIRHIRNLYEDKYKDKSYEEFVQLAVHHNREKLNAVKASHYTERFEMLNNLSKNIKGLGTSDKVVRRINNLTPAVMAHIDKIGLRSSILRFLTKMDQHKFDQITARVESPEGVS
jgi:hypothetical protein